MTKTSQNYHIRKHLLTTEASWLFAKYGNGLDMTITNNFMHFAVEMFANPMSVDKRKAHKFEIDLQIGGHEECLISLREKMMFGLRKLGADMDGEAVDVRVDSAGSVIEDGIFKSGVTHG